MIEIVVLLLGAYGVLAVPVTPRVDGSPSMPIGMVLPLLPGSENLDEKAVPLAKLVVLDPLGPPGRPNLIEQTRVPSKLPGTENLAEKRIPFVVLEKLSRPFADEASNASDSRA
ncbi:uncharacterized protein LOC117226074 [Megalopta genalis]|uniref:uncharacterized protein LOC117226074 n=1 Tax=Megalopta genalis TaxID=115081 RepID=UPI001442F314|nr:uncharacterized protein LOC117226074 [Megalopta genalis]